MIWPAKPMHDSTAQFESILREWDMSEFRNVQRISASPAPLGSLHETGQQRIQHQERFPVRGREKGIE